MTARPGLQITECRVLAGYPRCRSEQQSVSMRTSNGSLLPDLGPTGIGYIRLI